MVKWQASGLKMLSLRNGDAPGRFDVSMAASPKTHLRETTVDPEDESTRQLLDSDGRPYSEFGYLIPRNVILRGSFIFPPEGESPKGKSSAGYGGTNALGEIHTQSRVTSFPREDD